MPVLDGFQAVEQIREDETLQHIPVIFISAAYKDIAHKLKGVEVGGNDYLPQPVDPDELIFKVKANLRNKVLYDDLFQSRSSLAERERTLTDTDGHPDAGDGRAGGDADNSRAGRQAGHSDFGDDRQYIR